MCGSEWFYIVPEFARQPPGKDSSPQSRDSLVSSESKGHFHAHSPPFFSGLASYRLCARAQRYDSLACRTHVNSAEAMAGRGERRGAPPAAPRKDWQNIKDPLVHCWVWNNILQRNYRKCQYIYQGPRLSPTAGARKRNEEELLSRVAVNQGVAGSACTTPRSDNLEHNDNPDGFPWQIIPSGIRLKLAEPKSLCSRLMPIMQRRNKLDRYRVW